MDIYIQIYTYIYICIYIYIYICMYTCIYRQQNKRTRIPGKSRNNRTEIELFAIASFVLQCVLQRVAVRVAVSHGDQVVCHSVVVLQCVTVCVAACCSVLQRVRTEIKLFAIELLCRSVLQCVLQCVAVCCSVYARRSSSLP